MTERAADQVQEFDCTECGQPTILIVGRSEFHLCATCIMLPGWHLDPTLRKRLGPNLSPLPEQSADHNGVHNG
jgi:hypothetical protein